LKKNKPVSVGDILQSLAATTKLGKHLEHAQIWEHWEEMVGPQLAAHGRPKTVKDGQLRVEADSSVWMHKFSYKKWAIIKAVNRVAGKELVNDLFVSLIGDDEEIDNKKS
jgi:predicted nucleic acid-binding Zn ribbon protein